MNDLMTSGYISMISNQCDKLREENNQLKENNLAMQEEMCRTWEKLNIIKELRSWLKEMLDDEKDIFSVVRVKDVLSKLNELEQNND